MVRIGFMFLLTAMVLSNSGVYGWDNDQVMSSEYPSQPWIQDDGNHCDVQADHRNRNHGQGRNDYNHGQGGYKNNGYYGKNVDKNQDKCLIACPSSVDTCGHLHQNGKKLTPQWYGGESYVLVKANEVVKKNGREVFKVVKNGSNGGMSITTYDGIKELHDKGYVFGRVKSHGLDTVFGQSHTFDSSQRKWFQHLQSGSGKLPFETIQSGQETKTSSSQAVFVIVRKDDCPNDSSLNGHSLKRFGNALDYYYRSETRTSSYSYTNSYSFNNGRYNQDDDDDRKGWFKRGGSSSSGAVLASSIVKRDSWNNGIISDTQERKGFELEIPPFHVDGFINDEERRYRFDQGQVYNDGHDGWRNQGWGNQHENEKQIHLKGPNGHIDYDEESNSLNQGYQYSSTHSNDDDKSW